MSMIVRALLVLAVCCSLFLACVPAAPDDIVSVRSQLLAYLTDLPNHADHRVLSGHETGDSLNPANRFSARTGYAKYVEGLRASTGHVVALVGAGYTSYGPTPPTMAEMLDANSCLKTHWQRGGLVTVGMGPRNPWTGGQHNDTNRQGHTLTDAIVPGTAANANLVRQLDDIAAALADLRDAGVVVLWRPWHEFNGNWFWWGAAADGQDYINLWRYTHDYLTKTKQLDNLIWVFSASRVGGPWMQPIDKYYPGDDYVDIVGLDIYNDTLDQPAVAAYQTLSAHGKPFVLAEYGPDTKTTARTGTYDFGSLMDQIRALMPRTSYFMCWADYTGSAGNEYWSPISNHGAAELLADRWVVNADGVPALGRTR